MENNDILATGRRILTEELIALERLVETLDESFNHAVNAILACRGRIILIGVGKSGLVARKVAATMASLDIPAYFLHAGDAMHGDLGLICSEDVIVIASFSGSTKEILDVLDNTRHKACLTIAITNNSHSLLAQQANIVLDINVDNSLNYLDCVPTASSLVTMALGDALAVAVAETRNFQVHNFRSNHPYNLPPSAIKSSNIKAQKAVQNMPTKDYLIHKPRVENIPSRLRDLVDALVTESKTHFNSYFVGAFVLGSGSRGTFRPGSSDLDFYVVLHNALTTQDYQWAEQIAQEYVERFPIVSKIDFKLFNLQRLIQSPELESMRIAFKTEAAIVDGVEVLEDYHLPSDIVELARHMALEKITTMSQVRANLRSTDSTVALGRQIAKQLIRLVYYLAILRGKIHEYTPELRELQALAKNYVPDFDDVLVWAEQVVEKPPMHYELLKQVYDEGCAFIPRFQAVLGENMLIDKFQTDDDGV